MLHDKVSVVLEMLYDQDPPPRQCTQASYEDRDHARPDVKLSRLRSGDGG